MEENGNELEFETGFDPRYFLVQNDTSSDNNGFNDNISISELFKMLTDRNQGHSNFAQSVVNGLDIYVAPVIVLFGLLGNILSFVVFTFTALRRQSSSIYLAALSVADICFLACVVFSWGSKFGINIYHQDGWCQTFIFLSDVSNFLNVWYVVSFTVERYLAVRFPLRRKELCTSARAHRVVGCLAVVGLLLYSFWVFTSGVIDVGAPFADLKICGPLPRYAEFNSIVNNVDSMISFLVPFVVILVLNSLIAYKLVRFQQEHGQMGLRRNFSTRPRQHGLTQYHVVVEYHADTHRVQLSPRVDLGPRTGEGMLPSRALGGNTVLSSQRRNTKLLLLVSSVFLLLNSPRHIARLYQSITSLSNDSSEQHTFNPTYFICIHIFQLLYYLQFSLGIFLYSWFGKNFRAALCTLLRQFRSKSVHCILRHTRAGRELRMGTTEIRDLVENSASSSQNNLFQNGITRSTNIDASRNSMVGLN